MGSGKSGDNPKTGISTRRQAQVATNTLAAGGGGGGGKKPPPPTQGASYAIGTNRIWLYTA